MKIVGKSVAKTDALPLALGKPVYTEEIAPPDALVVKIMHSPHAFARIKKIDSKKALKIEGVACVLTHQDVPKKRFTLAGQSYPEPSPYDRLLLDEIVRYVGDAVAIVAAADGINMAKHGSRAITSSCGTVDMLEMLGIDVDCDVDLVKRSIEVAGIGIFNGMSGKVHPSALSRILSQIRFGTVLNIAGSLANPALPAYGVRGVYSREMVLPIARAMKEIGYKRAFVIHGRSGDDLRGMDELSTLGRTDVAELDEDGRIREYALNACDLGLEKGDESALLNRGNIEEEAVSLLRVLSGLDRGDRRDIVCLNAAPLLCITGRSEDLLEGVEKAGDIIDSGLAVKKLLHWVREQNRDPGERLERLEGMLELARA